MHMRPLPLSTFHVAKSGHDTVRARTHTTLHASHDTNGRALPSCLPLAVGEEVPVEDRAFGATGDEGQVHGVPCWDCLWVTTLGLGNKRK
jgi:hypothetical protein